MKHRMANGHYIPRKKRASIKKISTNRIRKDLRGLRPTLFIFDEASELPEYLGEIVSPIRLVCNSTACCVPLNQSFNSHGTD